MTQEFFEKNYKFGMDWLNGVLPLTEVDEVFDALESFSSKLKKSRWQLATTGKYNYKVRYMLDNKPFIQLMYNTGFYDAYGLPGLVALNPDECNNPYIFFSISGDGIRYLASIGGEMTALNKLLCYFYANGFKATRFDVYCDILDKKNEIVPLLKKSFDYFICPQVSKPTLSTNMHRDRKNVKIMYSHDDNGKRFYNLQLGHHGSLFGMFRCYNKLVEVQDGRLAGFSSEILKQYGVSDYWYRLEYEIHEHAAACFNAAMQESCENGALSVQHIFCVAAEKMFTPVNFDSVGRKLADSTVQVVWTDFLQLVGLNPYFVYVGAVPYVLSDRKRMRENMQRLKGYFYAMLLEYDHWSDSARQEFLDEARLRFESQKKYNHFRDELVDTVKGYSDGYQPLTVA